MRARVTSRRSALLLWMLALLCAAGFARLGVWQLARMHDKQALLAATHAVLAARTPQPLSIAADPGRARSYDWAVGRGRFIDTPAILLDNQAHAGRIGVRAYRAFAPIGSGVPVLVDLGWLPLAGDRHLPVIARPPGEWRVAGLLAPPPSAGLARPMLAPQPSGSLLAIALSTTEAQRALHLPALAPRVLRLDPALPLGYVRDLEMLPNTLPPTRHLGYAVQWFALAATVLVTALVLTFRKTRAHTRP
jgi:cytochrome oxidase assembly protein ShyY1